MTALRRVVAARQEDGKAAPQAAAPQPDSADSLEIGAAAQLLGKLSLADSAAAQHQQQQPPNGAIQLDDRASSGSSLEVQLAVTEGDMQAARGRVRPSGLREVALELPATRWSDIGGLAHVKQQLQVHLH